MKGVIRWVAGKELGGVFTEAVTLDPQRRRRFGLALQVPRELAHAVEVLRRHMDTAVVERRGRAENSERVYQVRPRQRDQIGAAGREDRVGVVGLVDVADGHGR